MLAFPAMGKRPRPNLGSVKYVSRLAWILVEKCTEPARADRLNIIQLYHMPCWSLELKKFGGRQENILRIWYSH